MYCGKCGKKIADDLTMCPHCGSPAKPTSKIADQLDKTSQSITEQLGKSSPKITGQLERNTQTTTSQSNNDNGGTGWLILGAVYPAVGQFLYLYFLGSRPHSSKNAGVGALIGFLAWLLMVITPPIALLLVVSGNFESPWPMIIIAELLIIPAAIFELASCNKKLNN